MRTSLPFLAAAVLLLAGPAAHAFSVETVDSSSAKAALATDPDERLTTHDDGNGNVTSHYTSPDHSFSFGTTVQSSRHAGFAGAPVAPWERSPWPAPRSDGGR